MDLENTNESMNLAFNKKQSDSKGKTGYISIMKKKF